jgi:hypothetical protein
LFKDILFIRTVYLADTFMNSRFVVGNTHLDYLNA